MQTLIFHLDVPETTVRLTIQLSSNEIPDRGTWKHRPGVCIYKAQYRIYGAG